VAITKVVVDRRAEALFRRRALRRYPLEYIESVWGRIIGTTAYIHAFMPLDHEATPDAINYDDADLWDQHDEAREEGLTVLGSIHTHPDRDDAIFSETDLREHVIDPHDRVMGICAIECKGKRRKLHIAYWPGVLPCPVIYTGKAA
jgi:proteasome lid subunit RPN8/RPN11